jgi:putative spermidine/putrescine transport system permease protein
MGALFLARRRGWLAGLLQSLFLAPLVFPTIILGVALLLLYNDDRHAGVSRAADRALHHRPAVRFSHVLASAQALDPALEEAGQSLGAGPVRTLFPRDPAAHLAGRPVGLAVRVHRLVSAS